MRERGVIICEESYKQIAFEERVGKPVKISEIYYIWQINDGGRSKGQKRVSDAMCV
jgi:hypothetical protein